MRKRILIGLALAAALAICARAGYRSFSENGWTTCVRIALLLGAPVSVERGHGGPLFDASREGHADTVRVLVNAGADPNARGPWGFTPLMRAASSGSIETVEALLDGGAELNAYSWDHAQTPVSSAEDNVEMVRFLLAAGADVNLMIEDDSSFYHGTTALTMAAYHGHVRALEVLVDSGAVVDHMTPYSRRTPLMYAALKGHSDAVEALLKHGADLEHLDAYGMSAFTLARVSENGESMSTWSNVQKSTAATRDVALLEAVGNNNLSAVKKLLGEGANPNTADGPSRTCLERSMWEGSVGLIRALLEFGADPNLGGGSGRRPLHVAGSEVSAEMVRTLIAAGADPNLTTTGGVTPLMRHVRRCSGATIPILLAAGADVNATLDGGYTALEGALHNPCPPSIVSCLLECGADPSLVDDSGYSLPTTGPRRFYPPEWLEEKRHLLREWTPTEGPSARSNHCEDPERSGRATGVGPSTQLQAAASQYKATGDFASLQVVTFHLKQGMSREAVEKLLGEPDYCPVKSDCWYSSDKEEL